MAMSSDSDEFYDAEDNLNLHFTKSITKPKQSNIQVISIDDTETKEQLIIKSNINDVIPKINKNVNMTERRKFYELRQRMQAEEDDQWPTNNFALESQDNSVLYTPCTSHPFRIIERDTVSMQSMTSGRIGRIFSRAADPSLSVISASKESESVRSKNENIECSFSSTKKLHIESDTLNSLESMQMNSAIEPEMRNLQTNISLYDNVDGKHMQLQVPDVIASTKDGNKNKDKGNGSAGPVAPPRKRKQPHAACLSNEDTTYNDRVKKDSKICLNVEASSLNDFIVQGSSLPRPISTVEFLAEELEDPMVVANVNNNPYYNRISRKTCHHSLNSLANNDLNGVITHVNNYNEIISQKFRNASSLSRSNTPLRSLNLCMATKGKYVVKPQDEDTSRAEDSLPQQLAKVEHEVMHCVQSPNMYGHGGHSGLGPRSRQSADDENLIKQLNMYVRMKTDSGKELADTEILEQVTVLNLDTGECVPLSVAEDKLPQCVNPLSLHLMRLTNEYVSTNSHNKQGESDEESVSMQRVGLGVGEVEKGEAGKLRKGTAKLKKILGSTVKKTMDKAKSIVYSRHRDDIVDTDELSSPGQPGHKFKNSASHKGPYEFNNIQRVQELSGQHIGPIWCMKFSTCGRLLATAGQDRLLRIWVLRDAYTFFQDMSTKYNTEQKVSPSPSQDCLFSQNSEEELENLNGTGPFLSRPYCSYSGHTSDLLDVSWSKNYFVLSSSMDKTVRLWHISRKECLCCFQHIDFVTAIVFHPRDDRYFLSGSLDGKIRLWSIPEKKVAVWNEVEGQIKLITAANFCHNGQFVVVGSYDGRCIFYTTDQLKYHTQIHVRSTRGKNATGRKISGIEPMPGEGNRHKILVTSNDSRIRLYDLRELNIKCKYKGYINVSSQIKASFSHDGKYIVSGSENQCIYVWKTYHDYSKFNSVRMDRNEFWEGVKDHNAIVTCAIFAPYPDSIIKLVGTNNLSEASNNVEDPIVEQHTRGCGGYVLVSADFNGCIKVFINKTKPKHSSLPASAMA